MDRTPDNERSNPLGRAFSKFLERGRVGRDEPETPPRTTQHAPARRAAPSASRPLAREAAGDTARPGGRSTAGSATPATRSAPAVMPPAATPPEAAAPTPTATRRTHAVVSGETLSEIAQRVYGRADRWRLIFDANRDTLDDPDRIYPGQVLVIPDAPDVH